VDISGPARSAGDKTDLLTPSTPVVPANVPDRFNEGTFTNKELVHDSEITDLKARVSFLEGRSNFLTGAGWAIGIFIVIVFAFIRYFWKGILKVMLAELSPPTPKS
jgi:hypothetical protein